MSEVVLYQFLYSHFNEKARWALDYKGIAHRRRSLLPGPHAILVRKLSDQRHTPVLNWRGDIVAGSAAIIDRLESDVPDPPLYPADPQQRAQALRLQEVYDEELGPATRTVVFDKLLGELPYMAALFARDVSRPKRFIYARMLPAARTMVARSNGTADPANVERCKALVAGQLDEIAAATSATGYLVGERFTVADLTAAALLMPLAIVEHPDLVRPEPMPRSIAALLQSYREHPAIQWAVEMFRRHR